MRNGMRWDWCCYIACLEWANWNGTLNSIATQRRGKKHKKPEKIGYGSEPNPKGNALDAEEEMRWERDHWLIIWYGHFGNGNWLHVEVVAHALLWWAWAVDVECRGLWAKLMRGRWGGKMMNNSIFLSLSTPIHWQKMGGLWEAWWKEWPFGVVVVWTKWPWNLWSVVRKAVIHRCCYT